MPDCVLSNDNRFYTALEANYGSVPSITASERLAVIKLRIQQQLETRTRRDKTGGRTFKGVSPGSRKRTQFNLQTYLVENPAPTSPPAVGPLVQGAMGSAPVVFSGSTAGSGSTTTQVEFSSAHGLIKGQAFGHGGDIRFVASVVNSTSVQVNAPFSMAPASGETLTPAVTYFPASDLPSVSIFDYWDPAGAIDRILVGGSCSRMRVKVNSDYHELEFSGEAQDVIDSESFTSGQGQLSSFPTEPVIGSTTSLPIPGNLGQAWLGTPANKFLTVTSALIEVDNDVDLRNREFGTSVPQCITAGVRRVTANFELIEADDDQSRGLYSAARSETPVGVMFQLGETPGSLLGIHMSSVVPQVPEFNDDERLLRWEFSSARAQGDTDDEVVIAFG